MSISSLIRKKLLTLSITSTYHGIFHQAIYSLAKTCALLQRIRRTVALGISFYSLCGE